MKQVFKAFCWLAVAVAVTSCQTPDNASFPSRPTASGSLYSDYGLPSSRAGFQNTDLED